MANRYKTTSELVKIVVSELTSTIAKAFRKDEILFIFDGSHSYGNQTRANSSDIDLTVVVPFSSGRATSINLPCLDRFTYAIRSGFRELAKVGIYPVLTSDYNTEASVQDLSKYYISAKESIPLRSTNTILINPVFCSSINSALVQSAMWSNGIGFWTEVFSNGILQYGTEEVRSKVRVDLLEMITTEVFTNRPKNDLSNSLLIAEGLINSTCLFHGSNINLPASTIKRDTIQKMKVVAVELTVASVELKGGLEGRTKQDIGPWHTIVENVGTMSEAMQVFVRRLDEIRNRLVLPNFKEISELRRMGVDAIDNLIIECKDIFSLYRVNELVKVRTPLPTL